MSNPKTICVFCASSSSIAPEYLNLASETGKRIAEQGWNLVYGGAQIGMMGHVADAVLKSGANVTGYIPEYMKAREIAHEGLTELHTTKDMHERQRSMMDASDGFIVLPGGLGTLAEFFEVLTWKQIGLHGKPIALINANNYWGSILDGISQGIQKGFIREENEDLFMVFDDLLPAIEFLKKHQ